MAKNAYMQKLSASWEQLQADWKKQKANAKGGMADRSIERQMEEIKNDFKAAGNMADDKFNDWGDKLDSRMTQLRKKMSS